MDSLSTWLENNAAMLGSLAAIATIVGLFLINGAQAFGAIWRRIGGRPTASPVPSGSAAAPAPHPAPPADRPSIAMLPLNAMSDDPAVGHLADGITEDVITHLARVPGFSVTARNSTFRYRGGNHDIRAVGRELGVRYVIEGSLRQIGESLRFTIQLIEAESGAHVWAGKTDQLKDSVLENHDGLISGIAASVQSQVMREEAQRALRKPVDQLEVWELIHRAFSPLLLGFRHGAGSQESVVLARRALEKAPNNARAKAVLAWSLANLASEQPHPTETADMREALTIGEEAIRLDRHDTMVLYCWGTVLTYALRIQEGIAYLERVLDINPSDAQALAMLGSAHGRMQRHEQAISLVQKAMRISPDDPRLYLWHGYLGFSYLALDDYEKSAEAARKAVQHHAGFFPGWILLAAALAAQGKNAEAQDAVRQAQRLAPGFDPTEQIKIFDYPGTMTFALKKQFTPLIELMGSTMPETGLSPASFSDD